MSYTAAAHDILYVVRRIVVAVAALRGAKMEDHSIAIDGAEETLLKSSCRACILVELLLQKVDDCIG